MYAYMLVSMAVCMHAPIYVFYASGHVCMHV